MPDKDNNRGSNTGPLVAVAIFSALSVLTTQWLFSKAKSEEIPTQQ